MWWQVPVATDMSYNRVAMHFIMVAASSSSHRTKKKVKKKRKPVNLQPHFDRKCSLVTSQSVTLDTTFEALSDAMFPSNDHHDTVVNGRPADATACGDFHLHRCDMKQMVVKVMVWTTGITVCS